MFVVFIMILVAAALSIYSVSLYRELYLRGHHNEFGRKVSLKSLKLILTKEISIEDKAIAIKCLKLYYAYLIVFYSSSILIVFFVVSSIINKVTPL